ncbi:uncharacterized protein LOC142573923 [Dermacentor variabilis]|uniref:uncharacterized protein LOC142573923 n=1 Tax=Dermacentor variabilis TaxID=34621 RepID=UPI003F5BDE10
MNVQGLFFAIVPLLVADGATGQAVCPNKTWNPIEDARWTRCVYYCTDSRGAWHIGYFLNNTVCWYTPERNGTCYDGLCYGSPPEHVHLSTASDEVFVTDSTPDSKPNRTPDSTLDSTLGDSGPTTTKAATATQEQKKKKKTKKKEKEEGKKEEKDKEGKKEKKKQKKGKKEKKNPELQEW